MTVKRILEFWRVGAFRDINTTPLTQESEEPKEITCGGSKGLQGCHIHPKTCNSCLRYNMSDLVVILKSFQGR